MECEHYYLKKGEGIREYVERRNCIQASRKEEEDDGKRNTGLTYTLKSGRE